VDLGSQVLAVEEVEILEDVTVPRRDSDLTAWVNVIHGCNERCSYCVVPNTRGREQSRTPQAIKVRIQRLKGGGVCRDACLASCLRLLSGQPLSGAEG